jgi:hypothetical protein
MLMKKTLLILSFALAFLTVRSQCNFEGSIRFHVTIEDDTVSLVMVKTYIKNGRVRMEANYQNDNLSENPSESHFMLDFNSGIIYEINPELKTITTDSINRKTTNGISKIVNRDSSRVICGYRCHLATIPGFKKTKENTMDLNCWFADSLLISVPCEIYPGEIYEFTNGKNLCLSFSTAEGLSRHGEATVNYTATAINKEIMPDSLFQLPAGYQIIQKPRPSNDVEIEYINTMELKEEPFPPPPPPPPPPVKTKKAVKPGKKSKAPKH